MIIMSIYHHENIVRWHLRKLRHPAIWRAGGLYIWERRGEVVLDSPPTSDREAVSVALKAVQDRLGER